MKMLSYLFMAVVFGVILGYGWCYYHMHQDRSISKQTEYTKKSELYIPPGYFKTKYRNHLLMQKSNG